MRQNEIVDVNYRKKQNSFISTFIPIGFKFSSILFSALDFNILWFDIINNFLDNIRENVSECNYS